MPNPLMKIGQPLGSIIQVAYTVEDIKTSMQDFSDRLGLGPWYISGPFVPPEGMYRGKPTNMEITLAIAFSGHITIELIQQHDTKPSAYQEFIERQGYGFHHWAIGTRDIDTEVQKFKDQGYEVAFSDRSPRGVRIVYMDTSTDLPGMTEIIEVTDELEDLYAEMYTATQEWDGTNLFRSAKSVSKVPKD